MEPYMQKLVIPGKGLDNGKFLVHYNIQEDSIVCVFMKGGG